MVKTEDEHVENVDKVENNLSYLGLHKMKWWMWLMTISIVITIWQRIIRMTVFTICTITMSTSPGAIIKTSNFWSRKGKWSLWIEWFDCCCWCFCFYYDYHFESEVSLCRVYGNGGSLSGSCTGYISLGLDCGYDSMKYHFHYHLRV